MNADGTVNPLMGTCETHRASLRVSQGKSVVSDGPKYEQSDTLIIVTGFSGVAGVSHFAGWKEVIPSLKVRWRQSASAL